MNHGAITAVAITLANIATHHAAPRHGRPTNASPTPMPPRNSATNTRTMRMAPFDQRAGRRASPLGLLRSTRMPQVVELPPIGQDQRGALAALVRVCKET